LVGRDTVYFLRLSEAGDFVPFLGANQAGQPVFGLRAEALEGEATLAGVLYAGRNRYLLLQDAGLENLVSPSLGSRFLIGVLQFLEILYWATGNYGWAIILFTLVAYLILYPLNRSQIRSMAKMQRLQPKLQKLQEKYKDDRQTLQKQMMELYRQEGVNPMGGCLPMLLQMPIFLLLWWAIRLSAEHFHLAPGFLWMPDLSQPDPYYIMVILNVGAMLFQTWYTQRRTPTQAAGMGQAIGYIFPLFMVIIFWSFPAGMWLYWLLSTVFRIVQQGIAEWELGRGSRPQPQAKPDGSQGD
jgi:YidC/Oxa1 family membrane protein insertase